MSKESIENITKSKSFLAPNFVNHYILPDKNFNGHCLINNISMSKKVINLYILLTYFIVKRFKHRFYIK